MTNYAKDYFEKKNQYMINFYVIAIYSFLYECNGILNSLKIKS